MPTTKTKKSGAKVKKGPVKKKAVGKKIPVTKIAKREEKKATMSQEMQNAMLLLFAGGMIVLAYVLYIAYA